MAAGDHAIEAQLTRFEDKSGGQALAAEPRQRKASRTESGFEARQHLHRVAGVDLTRINGIDALTALKVVAEIGLDMTRWPTEKHFASWLSRSPGSHTSGARRSAAAPKPRPTGWRPPCVSPPAPSTTASPPSAPSTADSRPASVPPKP